MIFKMKQKRQTKKITRESISILIFFSTLIYSCDQSNSLNIKNENYSLLTIQIDKISSGFVEEMNKIKPTDGNLFMLRKGESILIETYINGLSPSEMTIDTLIIKYEGHVLLYETSKENLYQIFKKKNKLVY